MSQKIGREEPEDTSSEAYARRLVAKQQVWWKRVLHVQAPYQWNLRRQGLGKTLDVGCGLGRNLDTLRAGSVGVDHNEASVVIAREHGRTAMTPEEFFASEQARLGSFDGMLIAHVIEHLQVEEGERLVREYLPYVRPGGKVFFVCPQERGFASDPTHVQWTTGDDLQNLARSVGLIPEPWYSFPFPRWAGKAFVYNEFCLLAHMPTTDVE